MSDLLTSNSHGYRFIKLAINAFVQLFVLLLFVPPFAVAAAPEQVVLLHEAQENGEVNRYVQFYLEYDTALHIEEVIEPSFQARFVPVQTREPDFGYFAGTIWLKLPIVNLAAEEQIRMLMMHTNFMSEIDVYLVGQGAIKPILQQDQQSVFSSRPVPYHDLVAPFTIQGNDKGAFYIRYRSNGDTVLPISIETPAGFASELNHRLVVDFAFYGVMAMMIITSLIGRLFFKNTTFISYALYAAAVLLLIFQRDGYAFQYFWPNAPVWNDFSSLPLGAMLPIFAAIFTRSYLDTKNLHPQIDKILIGVCIVNVLVILSSAIIGAAQAKQIALLTVMVSIIIFVSIGVAAFRKYGRRALFFVIGWSGLLLGTTVMATIHWFSVDITRAQSLNIMRIAMVFDTLMMGMASVFRIVDIQRDSAKLNQERIAVLDENVQLLERFTRLEEKHRLAQSLAETKNQLLVDTTHDLRQPLFSLRNAISETLNGVNRKTKLNEIEQSFNYIEDLVEHTLRQAIDRDESGEGLSATQAEIVEVQQLFSALENMFREDAKVHSVELTIAHTSLKIYAPSFVILRMMANLVSNAIRYAPEGRVLIGARRTGDQVSLEVHDTGLGMTEQELSFVQQRYMRGDDRKEDESGLGVGLSIVHKLAIENDLKWKLRSRKQHGTSAQVLAPASIIS